MHEDTPIKSHIAKFTSIINELDKMLRYKMRIKHFYYYVLYLLHTRALGQLSSMKTNQLSRSVLLEAIEAMRLRHEAKQGATMRPASQARRAPECASRVPREVRGDRLYALIICGAGRVTTR